MIVAARDVSDGMHDQNGMGLLDVSVKRNGYGRQVDSFEAALDIAALNGKPFPGVFIRSPLVESTGTTEVIATLDGHAAAVKRDRLLALCFHPALTSHRPFHREFVMTTPHSS